MTFEVTILGSNSAVPAHGRHPTAQVLNVNDKLYLIDCGEGTQIQLDRYKIKRSRIDHVFISHLHGDHYYGLMGLITSYHLNHRNKTLHIHGQEALQNLVEVHLSASKTKLCYDLQFHSIDGTKAEIVLENADLTVTSFPLKHRIPCTGFLFKEQPQERHIIPQMIEKFQIPVEKIAAIKRGNDFVNGNDVAVANHELTTPPYKSRSYAFCTDTRPLKSILPIIEGAELLYHEATFGATENPRAEITFHSTSHDAANIAKQAAVKELLIGHFSAKYKALDFLEEEAQSIFPNTRLALEGCRFAVERQLAPTV